MDPSFPPMKMDQHSYTSRLANTMHPSKTVFTRPQSTNASAQLASRYSAHVFARRDLLRRPLEKVYEGLFKVLQREPQNHIIHKNGTNDSTSIDRLKVAYLERNPIHINPPSQNAGYIIFNGLTKLKALGHPSTPDHECERREQILIQPLARFDQPVFDIFIIYQIYLRTS